LLDSGTLSGPECDAIPVNTGGDGTQKKAPSAVSAPSSGATEVNTDIAADVPPVSALGPAVVTHAPQNIRFDTLPAPPLAPYKVGS
jgi:hypothetical protein